MTNSTLVIAGMGTLAAGTYAFRVSGQLLRAKINFPPAPPACSRPPP